METEDAARGRLSALDPAWEGQPLERRRALLRTLSPISPAAVRVGLGLNREQARAFWLMSATLMRDWGCLPEPAHGQAAAGSLSLVFGPGGVGKSFVLHAVSLFAACAGREQSLVMSATTGVAAVAPSVEVL